MSYPTNPAVPAAHAVFDAINSRDLSCLESCVTDDFVDHGSPFPLPPGPAGYQQILTFVTQVLRIRYEIEDFFSTDDRIVLRAVAHGVGVDAVHGPGADGRTYAMPTVHIYRTEGDRLAEHWGVRDELGARIQLGVLAAPVAVGR
ncbi:ester cyclase [Gordonia sp. LSe1-13]|uniref:Ester cyclase n=1 Tax=Gordonia sesuvii TaxID=3116777 RepID=A0ABU7MEX4_9ACTN|nr:ester cyclase [Gordonia sp. LSe1-13]